MSGGERSQIAQIAVEIADSIFPVFGWTRTGTADHNFLGAPVQREPDEESEAASDRGTAQASAAAAAIPITGSSEKASTQVEYPADAVYRYPDPYFPETTFIHFDFKSYGESTIKPRTLNKDLQRLADTVAAADGSQDWISKFAPEQKNYAIHGALFVHNHDEKALDRFSTYLGKLGPTSVKMARGKRLFVFTPLRILYLHSVVADMKGLDAIPKRDEGETSYFYPYSYRYKPQSNLLAYATAETLLGPILAVRYRFKNPDRGQGYIVYYDGPGKEADEFTFLFEWMLKRRVLTEEDKVDIRMLNAAANCSLVFKKAKEDFVEYYHSLPAFKLLLDKVEYHRINLSHPNYSTIELGES